MIKNFAIYGERCSGTNFLFESIKENFKLEYSNKYNWKHFFGHYNFQNNEEENETLFIGIIRHPIHWIDSFYKKPHHLPNENTTNIKHFLFNEFYSLDENNKEIMEDRNYLNKERYKNIFEVRNIKNDFLIKIMPKKVKNYLLIRYEDLRDNYDVVLEFIMKKFNLEKKFENFKKINSYKGKNKIAFVKRNITLKRNIIKIIKRNINIDQENSIGYSFEISN